MTTYVSLVGPSSVVPLSRQIVLSIFIFHQGKKTEAKLCSIEVHRLPIQCSCKNILTNTYIHSEHHERLEASGTLVRDLKPFVCTLQH